MHNHDLTIAQDHEFAQTDSLCDILHKSVSFGSLLRKASPKVEAFDLCELTKACKRCSSPSMIESRREDSTQQSLDRNQNHQSFSFSNHTFNSPTSSRAPENLQVDDELFFDAIVRCELDPELSQPLSSMEIDDIYIERRALNIRNFKHHHQLQCVPSTRLGSSSCTSTANATCMND